MSNSNWIMGRERAIATWCSRWRTTTLPTRRSSRTWTWGSPCNTCRGRWTTSKCPKQHTKINLGGGGGRKKQEQLDQGISQSLSALPPSELFSKPSALKSYASKQLSWLLDPLKLKRGEGHFLGWEYEVDKSSYVFSAAEVAKLPSDTVTLSKFINWQDMKNMPTS